MGRQVSAEACIYSLSLRVHRCPSAVVESQQYSGRESSGSSRVQAPELLCALTQRLKAQPLRLEALLLAPAPPVCAQATQRRRLSTSRDARLSC